jgi:hypothetical protein
MAILGIEPDTFGWLSEMPVMIRPTEHIQDTLISEKLFNIGQTALLLKLPAALRQGIIWTPLWNKDSLEKLTVVRQFRNSFPFPKLSGSLSCSQQPILAPSPKLSQINHVRTQRSSFFKIHFNITLSPMARNCPFPSGCPTKLFYTFIAFPVSVTCPAHFILLNSKILTVMLPL